MFLPPAPCVIPIAPCAADDYRCNSLSSANTRLATLQSEAGMTSVRPLFAIPPHLLDNSFGFWEHQEYLQEALTILRR